MHCRFYAKGVRTSPAKPIANPSQFGPQIDPESTPNRPKNDSGGALGHHETAQAKRCRFLSPPGPNRHYFLGYFWDPFFMIFALRARLGVLAQIGAACGIQGIGPGRFRAVPGALLRDSGGPRGVVLGSLGGPEIIVLLQ